MKNETKKQLDRFQRKELLKNIMYPFLGFGAFSIILLSILLFKYSPGTTNEITGTVTGLLGVPHRAGEILYLLVALDDDTVVKVKKPKSVVYKKNQRVILIQTKTSIFGNYRYNFKSELPDTTSLNH